MIGLLRGTIEEKFHDTVLINCNGVGYEVIVPDSYLSKLPRLGEEITLYTHLSWKEDGVTLYGFLNREDREMFRMLIQVSGVGPKMALNCLSVLGPLDLLRALSSGDTKKLQVISGVGKKTAARLCVDLKEKAKKMLSIRGLDDSSLPQKDNAKVEAKDGNTWHEAYSALINLGYKPGEIRKALSRVSQELGKGQGLTEISELIKAALRYLARPG